VAFATFRQLGLLEGPSGDLAAQSASGVDAVGRELSEDITTRLCDRTAYVALFTIAFLIISIIFSVIGNVLDLSFGLPGLESVNHILGAVLGVARGVLIVVAITCVCRYLCLVIPEETIESTLLFRRFVGTNFLAGLLGI